MLHVGHKLDSSTTLGQLRTAIKPRRGVPHQCGLAPAGAIKEVGILHGGAVTLDVITLGHPQLVAVVVELLQRLIAVKIGLHHLPLALRHAGAEATAGFWQLTANKHPQLPVSVDIPAAFTGSLKEPCVVNRWVVAGRHPFALRPQAVAMFIQTPQLRTDHPIVRGVFCRGKAHTVGRPRVTNNLSTQAVLKQRPSAGAGPVKGRVGHAFVHTAVLPPLALLRGADVKNGL